MSEAIEVTEEEKRQEDNRVMDLLVGADQELQALLDLMFGTEDEGDDASFGIALSLPSGVLSGMAVNRNTWSKRMNETLRTAGGAGGQTLAASREKLAEMVEPKRKEARAAREEEGRPLPPRGFLHLKDAKLISGGQTHDLDNVRVDLRHVSAWALGSWAAPEA